MRKLLVTVAVTLLALAFPGSANAAGFSRESDIAGSPTLPGYCLDIGSTAPGTRVVVADCQGQESWRSQIWVRTTQNASLYNIKSVMPGPNGQEMCLDVGPGTAVTLAVCHFEDTWTSQKWAPIHGNGTWRMLRNGALQNGRFMCLDRSNSIGSGAVVTGCSATPVFGQEWDILW